VTFSVHYTVTPVGGDKKVSCVLCYEQVVEYFNRFIKTTEKITVKLINRDIMGGVIHEFHIIAYY